MHKRNSALNFLGVIFCLFTFIILGCIPRQKVQEQANTVYSVVDARGKTISFEKSPRRIVLLNYSATDVLTALVPLAHIVATDKWAREDDLSNCADKLKNIPVCEDNIEQIMQYKPDLVILSAGRRNELGDLLDAAGIKACVVQQPKTINDIPDFIKFLGKIVQCDTQAEKMAAEVTKYLNMSTISPRINGVVLLHPNGGIGQKGTMADSICQACNIENFAATHNFVNTNYLGKEQIVALNPSRLVVLDWSFGGQHKDAMIRKKDLLQDPGYQSVTAIQQGNVIIVPMKYFHCTSQYVVQNLEKLKQIMRNTL